MTLRRKASKRAAWGLADQAFSSITNFALASIVARNVTPRQFGAFSLIFAAYLLVLGVVRAFSTLPLLVRYSAADRDEWSDGARRATGWAVVGGAAGSVICLVVGLLFEGVRGPLLALALTLPGLMLQETWRLAFIARGTPAVALLNDVVWALALAPALILATHQNEVSVGTFVLAWGSSGTVAALVGIIQAGFLPNPRGAVAWTRTHWDISGRQLGEFATLSATNQIVMYAAGAIAGLVSAGALRAGQVLLGPLRTVYQGVWFVALSEFVRILKLRSGSLLRIALGGSLLLGVGGLAYGAAFIAFGPWIGPVLLGDSWNNAEPLMVPLTINVATTGFWLGANVGLRALEEPARSLRVRLAIGALTVTVGVGGLILTGDALGAAWGLAAASVVGVGLFWWEFVAALHDRHARAIIEPGADEVLEARSEDITA